MRRYLLLPALCLFLAGCDLIQRPPLEEGFGAPYQILVGVLSAESRVATPALDDDRLYAVVEYTGGCTDHLFRLDYTTTPFEARVRILHDAFGDTCESIQREELSLFVNEAIRSRTRITLVGPSGGEVQLKPATERPMIVQP